MYVLDENELPDRSAHLGRELLGQLIVLGSKYGKSALDNVLPLLQAQLAIRLEGHLGRLGDLASILERGTRLIEDHLMCSRVDSADLVRHYELNICNASMVQERGCYGGANRGFIRGVMSISAYRVPRSPYQL